MSSSSILFAAIAFLLACGREAAAPAATAAGSDVLRHYDIRPDRLPAPDTSSSAGNPPRVTAPPKGAALHVPPGFHIALYARDLSNPRGMLLAPNGDVILSEPRAGRILILRDADHDGIAEQRFTFASGLDEPYGLALRGGFLYVGDEDAILRIPYMSGQTAASGEPQRIAALPSGGHSTRGILFNADGSKMYVSVGSESNVRAGEPPERAAILEFDPDGGDGGSSPRDCAIRSAWRGNRRPGPSGPRSTNATASAMISSPTSSPMSAAAPSTAGPTPTSAGTKIRAAAASVPIWWPGPRYPRF